MIKHIFISKNANISISKIIIQDNQDNQPFVIALPLYVRVFLMRYK